MSGGDDLGLDARVAYGRLIAIADRSRKVRQQPEKCTALDVGGLLEDYGTTRTLCNGLTCGGEARVSMPDLGRIDENKDFSQSTLISILVGLEVECFKGIGALGRIIALISEGENPHR